MSNPLELTFRGMGKSDFIEEAVRSRYQKLSRLGCDITHCHVIVDCPHQHQQKGRQYEVHIELHVPGAQLTVSHKASKKGVQEVLYPVIADAFDAMERQLNTWNDKRHQEVKAHSLPTQPGFEESIPGEDDKNRLC